VITGNEVSLYFHIPFCTQKCPYCHFYVIPNRPLLQDALAEGLALEWRLRQPWLAGKTIVSIYFGGGTPTLFALDRLADVLQNIPLHKDLECTIEANPDGVDVVLFKQLRQLGLNRLSFGVQSLDDASLSILGRSHSASQAKSAIWEAKIAGFENISIDLMYDLPKQTEESWFRTLEQLTELPITHLSLYNLTFEPHTLFYRKKETLHKHLPNAELSLRLLEQSTHVFEQIGLHRYEISAFARKGYESRHNSGYWTGRPFLGFGPSAFSYWEWKRFRNQVHLQRYRRQLREGKSPIDFEERLSDPDRWKEQLAIQLRLLNGVQCEGWPLPEETRQTLHRLKEEGLLLFEQDRWRLSSRGLLYYDSVASELI
jgi:oxygen-independent coproporphyrinogen III oxidase